MPFITGGAKAIWLDDDRVLVKGIPASGDRGFASGENLSSSVPKSSTALAIFNLKLGRWTDVASIDSLAGSSLLDAQGFEARFFDPGGGSVLRLDLKTNQVQPVAQLSLRRSHAVARLLAGNVLVAAGGKTAGEQVSEIDEQCAANAQSACPDRYVGIGPTAPTTDYESIAFGEQPDVAKNLLSHIVSSDAKSAAIAIGHDTTVYLLASDAENTVQRLVRSVRGSRTWQPMPSPSGAKICNDDCALLVAPDPRDEKKELLFLRQGPIDHMYVDDAVAGSSVNVWLWDQAARQWQLVLKTDGKSARAVPQQLDLDALRASGGRLMAMGWHLDSPILWAAP